MSKEKRSVQFSGRGKIWSYTIVSKKEAPVGFEDNAPYPVAMIRLEEGPLVTAQLTDFGHTKIEIGIPVEMVTRKLRSTQDERGMILYGYKFRPVLERSTPRK